MNDADDLRREFDTARARIAAQAATANARTHRAEQRSGRVVTSETCSTARPARSNRVPETPTGSSAQTNFGKPFRQPVEPTGALFPPERQDAGTRSRIEFGSPCFALRYDLSRRLINELHPGRILASRWGSDLHGYGWRSACKRPVVAFLRAAARLRSPTGTRRR